MKTSLSNLPESKQQELQRVTQLIVETAHPEMIILFGSYATGTWVEDEYFEDGTRYSYISDYDILVITKNSQEKEHILNDKIVNRSRHVTNVSVNCIIHDIEYVNEGLSFGQYFFADIVKEGVVLFDSGRVEFVQPKELTPKEQKEIAQNYLEIWLNKGAVFLKTASFLKSENDIKEAAFILHQATECFYNTILLVFTGYKPKTHSLEKLRQYAKPYSKELMQIFPDNTSDKTESHLFDLLKRGYIDARYKNEFTISEEELSILLDKVRKMKGLVQAICQSKIASFSNNPNRPAQTENDLPVEKE